MKRGLKWLLAAGVISCLLGAGMMTAGAMMGGFKQLWYAPPYFGGRITGPSLTAADALTDEAEYTKVRELKIELAGRSRVQLIELAQGELPDDTIRIVHSDSEEARYELKNQGDTLMIRLPDTWKPFTGARRMEDLVVYMPPNYQFQSVSIECISGELNADAVYTQELSIENVSGTVVIDGGKADTLELECLSGTTECAALINREAKVECTSGMVDIMMAGSPESYDYKWSCLSGTITAAGRELESGITDRKKEQNNGTGNEVKLECLSGTIQVNYQSES